MSVSWWRLWKMNFPEALLIILGVVSASVQGTIYPMFAFFFGQVLRVFTLPFDQVIDAIHVWAVTFVILGGVSGLATFFKVRKSVMRRHCQDKRSSTKHYLIRSCSYS